MLTTNFEIVLSFEAILRIPLPKMIHLDSETKLMGRTRPVYLSILVSGLFLGFELRDSHIVNCTVASVHALSEWVQKQSVVTVVPERSSVIWSSVDCI